jgi:hypothetical protein
MRRFLFIVAMLSLIAAPAMATITIRAQQHQPANVLGAYTGGRYCNAIDVNYTCSAGERIRAFALELTLDPASGFTFNKIDTFKVGESNATSKGFGIFPGKFRDFIDPAAPNWADGNYNPIAPATDADATGTGLGTNKVILELGSLFVGDANRPASTGTLCRLYVDVNKPGLTGFGPVSGNFTFGGNATRGGVVLEDGTAAAPTYSAIGRAAAGVFSLQKTFPCWQPYDVQFNEWLIVWEPRCWAGWQVADANWRVQCLGDADNKTETLSKFRVYSSDYNALVAGWAKKATLLRAGIGMCCDFDHKSETLSKFRCYSSDYTLLVANWAKKETVMRPWCPKPD